MVERRLLVLHVLLVAVLCVPVLVPSAHAGKDCCAVSEQGEAEGVAEEKPDCCSKPAGTEAPQAVDVDHADPPVSLAWTDLRGRGMGLALYRGRPVVLNFWATWCKPCVTEMPDLIELHDRYAPYGVEFIGAAANSTDQRDEVLAFTEKLGINFPIVIGADTGQMKSVGLLPLLPGTILLDEHGHVVARFPGVIRPERLKQELDTLLGLRAGRPTPVTRVAQARTGEGRDPADRDRPAIDSRVPS